MYLLKSLFSGAKALLSGVREVVKGLVVEVLKEFDRSSFGQAATTLVKNASKHYFSSAQDLADEEREYAVKRQRDGKLKETDLERLYEIQAERDALRKELETAKAAQAAKDLEHAKDGLLTAELNPDEAAAAVGILASKECPECGGTMRIVQGGFNTKTEKQTFYWRCTAPHAIPCPTIALNPEAEKATVLREPDPDLDGPHAKRRAIWERPDVLAKAHGRLRQGLGDADEEVICPTHLLPMKLMPRPEGRGLMLDSYHYICLGVHPNGHACEYTVDVKSFPQVAATLKRRDGVGIIEG